MAYVTLEEFVRQLGLDSPTPERLADAQQAIDAAAEEIDSYLGYTTEAPAPDPVPALVVTVNIDRGKEHFRHLAFGVLNQGPETVPVLTFSNTWRRHAQKLLPLKTAWGVG